MGMHMTVYVGPYLIVPRSSGLDWYEFDSIVCEGRGEAGVDEQDLILIPNQSLDGVDRNMVVDAHGEQDVAQIDPADIVKEKAAFGRLAGAVFQRAKNQGFEVREAWGVVPCWS